MKKLILVLFTCLVLSASTFGSENEVQSVQAETMTTVLCMDEIQKQNGGKVDPTLYQQELLVYKRTAGKKFDPKVCEKQ